jgi:predicted GIY-YIG superfamily endonuclease
MDILLLEHARLGLRIRQEYARTKADPEGKYFVYVLQLQGGKFYVGTTDNIYSRLLDHKLQNASSAVWVRTHGPVERVVEIVRDSPRDAETYKTMEMMDMFGYENVRGSSWCKADMSGPPTPLASFAREHRKFEYLSREEIDAVCHEVSRMQRDFLFG